MCRLKSRYGHILQACQLLVFFGAPHNGLRTKELEAMIDDLQPKGVDQSRELLDRLRENSTYLEEHRDHLVEILKGKNIISYYERILSPVVQKVRLCVPKCHLATDT